MDIYSHSVIILKKSIPHLWLVVKLGVVENKPAIWIVFFDYLSRLCVPFFENFSYWLELRLVDWLKGINLGAPFLHETFMNLKIPFLRSVIDIIVLLCGIIPVSKPSWGVVFPVGECCAIFTPYYIWSFSTIVVSILWIFHGMDVHQNLDVVLLTSVKKPLNFVLSAVHTPNVWTVRTESPISNWQSNNFNFLLCELFDDFVRIPSIPMSFHYLIALYRPKSLAKSVWV